MNQALTISEQKEIVAQVSNLVKDLTGQEPSIGHHYGVRDGAVFITLPRISQEAIPEAIDGRTSKHSKSIGGV